MEKSLTQLEILDFFFIKKMLTTNEAANYLNLSPPYIIRLANQGKIKNYDPGDKTLYYDINDLDNYLISRKKMTQSEIDTHAFKYVMENYRVY
jgi:excisionase family DNA binding protein